MTGVSYSADFEGMDALNALFARLADPDLRELMEGIGQEGVSQTQRRIAEEKTDPSGVAWEALSDKWARRKVEGVTIEGASFASSGGILEFQGDLRDSMTFNVEADNEVEWGSNLVYAATHQFGDETRGIPQREYLGLSDENADDILEMAEEFVNEVLL